jgi:hypothetical protein
MTYETMLSEEVPMTKKVFHSIIALCKTRELLPIAFRVLDDMKVRERKERKGEEGRGKGERDRRGREVKR